MEAPVSMWNLWPERDSWRNPRLESTAWTSCWPVSFPEPRNKEHSNDELGLYVCDDTSRGPRLGRRMEQEDWEQVEQEKEQHGEQVEVDDLNGGRWRNHLDQEEEQKQWTQHSQFWRRRTAKFDLPLQLACEDLKYLLSSSEFSHSEANDGEKILWTRNNRPC